MEAYEKKSVKADENIRQIREKKELEHAIDDCVCDELDLSCAVITASVECFVFVVTVVQLDAAGHEFSFSTQRSLLKAAAYGKLCCGDAYEAGKFVDTCRTMRVLNAVRHYEIGVPLTYEQYAKLEGDVLVDRLINRHRMQWQRPETGLTSAASAATRR